MNPDKCFPSPLFLAVIIIIIIVIIIIILFGNYYSCAATTITFTPIDNYLIAYGSSQNITFADRTFIADSQHSTVRFQSQSSVIATINSSNISPIYQSTRIFTEESKKFPSLTSKLNTSSSAAAEAPSPSLSRSTSAFSPARSAATRRRHREI
ncbi:receptor-like protein kinase THESEUS 1 [Senna tora]|uniref:Receptor-like protein kinase THESEUS 1 n=1 Tax=Senna tora TaxID=362788 RepID=A0A834X7D9_9FABA|nr:receptor-like protein kinase THESEUS 1 [Senna tora]